MYNNTFLGLFFMEWLTVFGIVAILAAIVVPQVATYTMKNAYKNSGSTIEYVDWATQHQDKYFMGKNVVARERRKFIREEEIEQIADAESPKPTQLEKREEQIEEGPRLNWEQPGAAKW